jgi:hypothetical protein
VWVALGGCGPSLRNRAPATASAACRALHGVSATRSARCLGGAQADWEAYMASQDDCAAYDRHVAEHQVEYVPAGWDACVAENDGPCDKIPSPCFWEILHGLVADGQHCQDTEVCGTYSACFAIGSETCGEVRVALEGEGTARRLHCDDSGRRVSTSRSASSIRAARTESASREGHRRGLRRRRSAPCSFVLHCTADPADPASTGTCQPRAAGGPCRVDNDCPGAGFCLAGTCAVRRPGASCADATESCVPGPLRRGRRVRALQAGPTSPARRSRDRLDSLPARREPAAARCAWRTRAPATPAAWPPARRGSCVRGRRPASPAP